jgi:hypothetical protein
MDIPVLVEQVGEQKFVARSGEPFGLTAEGTSHAEAVSRLTDLLRARLANGARLDWIRLPDVHPLARDAGTVDPNDPMYQEYLRGVAEFRRQMDETPEPWLQSDPETGGQPEGPPSQDVTDGRVHS